MSARPRAVVLAVALVSALPCAAQDAPAVPEDLVVVREASPNGAARPADPAQAHSPVYAHEITGATGVYDIAADPLSADVVWLAETTLGSLGRYDARGGELGHISLGNGAAPRSLAAAPDRRVFLADPVLDVIHEVDPDGETIRRHAMPPGEAVELTALALDPAGRPWFTAYDGYVGRLDPRTGDTRIARAPGGRGPSAITVGPRGEVWFASYPRNYVARIDPETLNVETFQLPTGASGPKRLAMGLDGSLWVTASASGQLLRLDPRRRWRVFPFTIAAARPYAVAVDAKDRVLVSELTDRGVWRLDPATARFERLLSSEPGAGVRAIAPVGDTAWVFDKGADRILRLPVGKPEVN